MKDPRLTLEDLDAVEVRGSAGSALDALDGSEPSLGLHLKHARLARGMRLKELADLAECSESILSKLENNKAAPSLKLLQRICGGLNITVGDLFSWAKGDNEVVMHVRERAKIEFKEQAGPSNTMQRLGPPRLRLEGFLHQMEPGWSSGTQTHEGEELGYLINGSLELVVGERTFEIRAGDSFSFQSDTPHTYRNISDEIAVVVIVNSPPSV